MPELWQARRKRSRPKNHPRRNQSRAEGKREGKMQGFIEVTRKDDGKKILLNISGIDGVFPEAKGAGFCG